MTATALPRRHRVGRLAAHVVFTLFVVGTTLTLVLRAEAHEAVWQVYIIPFTGFAVVGWVIGWRRPQAPIAWVFLSIAALTVLGTTGDALVALALHRGWRCDGIVLFAAWTQLWFWYPLIALATGHSLLLFPDGLPSRRWRPVLIVMTAAVATITVMAALAHHVSYGKQSLPNPVGVFGYGDVEHTTAFTLATIPMALCVVASIGSLVVRYRRAGGVVRAQLKWFVLGAALLGVNFILSAAVPAFNNSSASNLLMGITLTFLPVSSGLAILRYRLYDIDRVVSRTVSYFVVTGVIAGVYVGVVALIESVLGFSSSVAVAASTLAAAAAFQPLRSRVQRVVDRRFDRAAYDARRTVEAFSNRLRDEVDADTVRADLLATVTAAIAPANVSLWVAT